MKAALPPDASIVARLRRFGLFKLLALMFAAGFLMLIVSVHLIPFAVRLGISPRVADKLPFVGFACGMLVIFCAAISSAAMEVLKIGLLIPLTLFGLAGGALAFVMSFLWALAFLDVALIAAAVTVVFVVAVAGLNKLYEMIDSRGRGARK